jgi:hypothetical protein
VEAVDVLACAKSACVAAVGRHAAAPIVAPPISNRRRDGEASDDAATTLCGVARSMVDIAVLLAIGDEANLDPQRPRVWSVWTAVWTIGAF